MKPGDLVKITKLRELSISKLQGPVEAPENPWVGIIKRSEVGIVVSTAGIFPVHAYDEVLVLFSSGLLGWQSHDFFKVIG